jgi:hypothetical protein
MKKRLVFCFGLFGVFSVSEIQSMQSSISQVDIRTLPVGIVQEILDFYKERHKDALIMPTRGCDSYGRLFGLATQDPWLMCIVWNTIQNLGEYSTSSGSPSPGSSSSGVDYTTDED